jgi:hydrogenase maturation protease
VKSLELDLTIGSQDSELNKKILVLGIGNTLLGDDGAGVRIVRQVAQRINSPDVCFKETSAAGLNLLDLIIGFDSLIVVDAILTDDAHIGHVFHLSPQPIEQSASALSLHSCGLDAALKLAGKLYQAQVPRNVTLIAVGIQNVDLITETLSPAVEAALDSAAEMVLTAIRSSQSAHPC